MALGIDFGTSNSAAAIVTAEGQLCPIALEGTQLSLPTALFFAPESEQVTFGSEALQAYLKAAEEHAAGGRLMRAIKSLLGSKLMDEQTLVNGRPMSFFDVVVLFFKEIKARSERQLGHTVSQAVLGRPVHFVDDNPQRDALAQATLERAAKAAGFDNVTFQLEPIAAAFDFEQRVDQATTALVVDIGGGTSDFTVIQLGPKRRGKTNRSSDILATTGTHIGGTDFDRMLNLSCVMPFLGLGHIGPTGREVPSGVFFDLSTWHLIHHAYARKSLHQAGELWRSYTDRNLHQRLMQVLEDRMGHHILADVEAAKIACSVNNSNSDIDLSYIESNLTATLSPQALRETLRQPIGTVVQCAQQCVQAAGLHLPDVIYLTGGSSALGPLVEALRTVFAGTQIIQGDRFCGVAAGLAWAGHAQAMG